MTVIYSYFNDPDTKVLKMRWEGLENVTLVTNGEKERIRKALEDEKDTVLFCGHGSRPELWMPHVSRKDSFSYFTYAFSKKQIPLIKAKNIIGIWCYASQFAEEFNLSGFYTSMFISSAYEAALMGINGVTADKITRLEEIFALRINKLLKNGVPLSEWKGILSNETLNNDAERFNHNGLTYREQ